MISTWACEYLLPLGSSTDMHHAPARLLELRLADVVPRFLFHHRLPDVRRHLIIIAATHHRVQVMVHLREKTRPYLAIARDPDARTGSAERLAHRGDDADLDYSVGEPVASRGFASAIWDLLQRWKLAGHGG